MDPADLLIKISKNDEIISECPNSTQDDKQIQKHISRINHSSNPDLLQYSMTNLKISRSKLFDFGVFEEKFYCKSC